MKRLFVRYIVPRGALFAKDGSGPGSALTAALFLSCFVIYIARFLCWN